MSSPSCVHPIINLPFTHRLEDAKHCNDANGKPREGHTMTRLLLISLREGGTADGAALKELRALADSGGIVLDGPFLIKDPLPEAESKRLSRAAELLKETARRKRIAEGLARAKAEGRRIGRPPSDRVVTAAQIVLARDSGRSWRSIEEEYRIPATSARRYCQNVRFERPRPKARKTSRQEARQP